MNSKEEIQRLYEYYKKSLPHWLLRAFASENYSFQETYLKEPWQKSANIKRPEELIFDNGNVRINGHGIVYKDETTEWKNIGATAFMIATIPGQHRISIEKVYLLVLQNDGQAKKLKLGRSVDPYKLLGHYIEEYKQLYFQSERI